MELIVTVTFDAATDMREALIERLLTILPDTRAFDGCERIELAESADTPGSFVMVEQWATADHFDRYKTWRVESGTSVLGSDLVTNVDQRRSTPIRF